MQWLLVLFVGCASGRLEDSQTQQVEDSAEVANCFDSVPLLREDFTFDIGIWNEEWEDSNLGYQVQGLDRGVHHSYGCQRALWQEEYCEEGQVLIVRKGDRILDLFGRLNLVSKRTYLPTQLPDECVSAHLKKVGPFTPEEVEEGVLIPGFRQADDVMIEHTNPSDDPEIFTEIPINLSDYVRNDLLKGPIPGYDGPNLLFTITLISEEAIYD